MVLARPSVLGRWARVVQAVARMGVARFEDLHVWQHAKRLCDEIGSLLARPTFVRHAPLSRQLDAAAISTVANIAEGFLRRDGKDFARFVRIAAASNGEARALLYAAEGRA